MSSSVFQGSCLCGSVHYEIEGDPSVFNHCYCSRCRKASGTGHASNIIMRTPERFEWTSGEELLGEYQVPDAERFRTVFCTRCGSQLPRQAPDNSYALIPAGSLDSESPIQPTDRIMWDSRSDWSCDDREIPTWSEYRE